MATRKLTAREVASLTTDKVQEDIYDELTPGLVLRVGRGGTKAWYVRYRANGRQRRMKIGTFPRLSLADARKKARDTLAEAEAGEDPASKRQERKRSDTTFAALAEEVLEAKSSSTRPDTRRMYRQIVDAELLPAWGAMPAAAVSRRDVVQLVEHVAGRAPVQANRVLATVRTIYNTGLRRGFPGLESNPAHMVEMPSREDGRDRYLDRGEIKAIWKALEFEAPVTKAIFRATLLTAQRIGSVCALRWSDIDGADVWTIPPVSFKGRRPHMVPLSAEALAALEPVRQLTGDDEYAFPGRSDGKLPHVASTNSALRRIRQRAGIPHWTAHDFRTTFRTWATRAAKPANRRDPAGLGVAPHVADAVLGHKEASLGFSRYTGEQERYLLAEKREALIRWGAFVVKAVAG